MVQHINIDKPFLKPNCRLAEGPIYDKRNNVLAWVDIIGKQVHLVDLDDDADKTWKTHRQFSINSPIGALGLTRTPLVYLCAYQEGAGLLDFTNAQSGDSLKVKSIETVTHDIPGKMRFNDGIVDAQGNFYASSMFTFGEKAHFRGKLYKFVKDGVSAEVVWPSVQIGNGLGFSPDNSIMYFVDSLSFTIWKIPLKDGEMQLNERKEFIKIEGYDVESPEPDGMCVSKDGDLWVAVWSTGSFRRYGSDGSLKAEYHVPAERVSCVAFAGKNGNDLIITTASLRLDEETGPYNDEKDQGGQIFRVKIDDTKGIEEFVSNW